MRRLLFSSVLASCSVAASIQHFENAPTGSLPPGWVVAMTHDGGKPRWAIVRDLTAPSPPYVLAQVSRDATAGRFPLAIWEGVSLRNGDISVAFKTVDGTIDQAAGLVWRYRDSNNYYIARANALESNVVFYKVENGTRTSIAPKGLPSRAYGVKREVPQRSWNRLRVVFQDQLYQVFLNDEHVFDAEDQTFLQAGLTGLWTKADSLIYFDDFSVIGQRAGIMRGWRLAATEGRPGRFASGNEVD